MLIFISDLHFIDETAGRHNIPPAAFHGVFQDIKTYAGNPSEVKIVLLGDVFDLVRTTKWLDVPEDERPWGDVRGKAGKIESHAHRILTDIIDKNPAVNFLKNGLGAIFGVEPEKIYLPGNHDRLCDVYPALRETVRNALGLPGGDEPFPHAVDEHDPDSDYRAYGLHGHEFDPWNYEGGPARTWEDYAQVPIGEVLACEFVSKLPDVIAANLDASVPAEQRETIRRNFQEVDNVRPFLSILQWIFYQVSNQPELRAVVDKSLKQIGREFEALSYYRTWRKKKLFSKQWPMAIEAEAVLGLAKCCDIGKAEKLLNALRMLGSTGAADRNDGLNRAADLFLCANRGYRSLIMGHTHDPLQYPVQITKEGMAQVYLNTGTWRKRYVQGAASGFIDLKYVTYAVFYNRKENPFQFYETWTGALHEKERAGAKKATA